MCFSHLRAQVGQGSNKAPPNGLYLNEGPVGEPPAFAGGNPLTLRQPGGQGRHLLRATKRIHPTAPSEGFIKLFGCPRSTSHTVKQADRSWLSDRPE